ncbi:hypothetical protein HELRODRAFT_194140 [Helobdella robusta]|uniref:Uncharacterized protein n=1 Tax=Helobdella robusta TaxID=6412 RepID=T1FVR1_HELRO|nr:hypothetical protein HELRODRAFT_194140 [Helobdella robusta]ESN93344.1 hypothetical protein HELRODRAFT_194140 [Helobdella robusta]
MTLTNSSLSAGNLKVNQCLINGNDNKHNNDNSSYAANNTATKCFDSTSADLSSTFTSLFNFLLFVVGLAVCFSAINALLTIKKKWRKKYQRHQQLKLHHQTTLQNFQQQHRQQLQPQQHRSSQQLLPQLPKKHQQQQQLRSFISQTKQEMIMTSSCTTENGNRVCIQLLTSSVICDVIHSMSCIPLCLINKKNNDIYSQFNWVDNVFRGIYTFHILALAVSSCKRRKCYVKDVNLKDLSEDVNGENKLQLPETLSDDSVFERKPNNDTEATGAPTNNQPNKQRSLKTLKVGLMVVVMIWCFGALLGSLPFLVYKIFNYNLYNLKFKIPDKLLLIFLLVISHLSPAAIYLMAWFKNRRYHVEKFKKFTKSEANNQYYEENQYKEEQLEHLLSKKDDVRTSTRNQSRSSGESSFLSYSPTALTAFNKNAESKKKKTNLSTLTLAGSFNRKNRDFSSSCSFKKRSSAKYKSQRMSPQLDRHPSLRYSIKRKQSTGLSSLADFEKDQHNQPQQEQPSKVQQLQGNTNLSVAKRDDEATMKHVASKTSNYLSVESSPTAKCKIYQTVNTRVETESRSSRNTTNAKHFKENHKRSKSKKSRSKNISGPSSGDDSAKSSRSSSKSDRSSDSCRFEGHPSLRYSTRRKIPRSREVLNKLASVEKIALLNRSIEAEMIKIDGCSRQKVSSRSPHSTNSRDVIDNAFLSQPRTYDRNRFGGSMKILGNKRRDDDDSEIVKQLLHTRGRSRSTRLSFRNISASKSHIDAKKTAIMDRHPSFRYSTRRKQFENSRERPTGSNYFLNKKNQKNIPKSPSKNSENMSALDPSKANIIMTRYLETANSEKSKLRRIASFYLNKTFPHIFIHKSRSYSNLNPHSGISPEKNDSEKQTSTKAASPSDVVPGTFLSSSERLCVSKSNIKSPTVNNLLSVSTVDTEMDWKTGKNLTPSNSFKLKPPPRPSFKRNQRHSSVNETNNNENADSKNDSVDDSRIMANVFSGGHHGRYMIRHVTRQISFFSLIFNIPLSIYFMIFVFSINNFPKGNTSWSEYLALYKLVCITISYFGCCIRCCVITKGSNTNKELFRKSKSATHVS